MDAKELLDRYAEGERDFTRANLNGADLNGASITVGNRAVVLP